jgi:hypothetical protein
MIPMEGIIIRKEVKVVNPLNSVRKGISQKRTTDSTIRWNFNSWKKCNTTQEG